MDCKTHPDAPHGFVRNASHTEDRYVCECEYWEPEEMTDTPKTEFTEQEKALYEFMCMFSLHEKEMLQKLVDWYPKAARDLEKGIMTTREMARIFR